MPAGNGLDWLCYYIEQGNPKRLQQLFHNFNIIIIICHVFKYETIETHACAFLTFNILAIRRVDSSPFNEGAFRAMLPCDYSYGILCLIPRVGPSLLVMNRNLSSSSRLLVKLGFTHGQTDYITPRIKRKKLIYVHFNSAIIPPALPNFKE